MNAVIKFLVVCILRGLNWTSRAMHGLLGVRMMTFSRDRLVKSLSSGAKREIVEPQLKRQFDLLTSQLSKENLAFFGVVSMEEKIAQFLNTRAEVLEMVKQEPAILETKVRGPVVIISLPRTGSTYFHNILSQDPQFKAPLLWEMVKPLPPPKPTDAQSDPRRTEVQDNIDIYFAMNPGVLAVHEVTADMPEDNCGPFFNRCCLHWDLQDMPDYMLPSQRAVTFEEHVKHLEFVKLQLQVIGWHQGMSDRRFLIMDHYANIQLDSFTALDAYLKVFPDVTFVQTVRNPQESIPSYASLSYQYALIRHIEDKGLKQRLGKGAIDQHALLCNGHADYVEKCKDVNRPTRVTSVQFTELMTNPIEAVESLYWELGLRLSDEARNSMARYITNRPRHKRGRHTYTREDFGLSQSEMDASTKRYTDLYM